MIVLSLKLCFPLIPKAFKAYTDATGAYCEKSSIVIFLFMFYFYGFKNSIKIKISSQ